MRMKSLPVLAAVFTLLILSPVFSLAEDGATLYKSKCAICHSPDGSGRKALKGSNLLSEVVRKRTDTELAAAIGKGTMKTATKPDEGHAFEKEGISPDQTMQLVVHIRSLQQPTKK